MVSLSSGVFAVALMAICSVPQAYCYDVCSQSGSIEYYCSGLYWCCGETTCCTNYWLWVIVIGGPILVCVGIVVCICRYRRRQRSNQQTTVVRNSAPTTVVMGQITTTEQTFQGQQAYPQPTPYPHQKQGPVQGNPPSYYVVT
ncbi:uncharacterized protein [Ptychodera flava]|uniref:uncharacterized protein n=1 Tax=Ptychodera flava TaxID=63121 RepID=UPI003969F73F